MDPAVAAAVVLVGLTAAPYVAFLALYVAVRPSGSPVDPVPPEPGAAPTVSVVLPTYNEADIVERKLHELCELDYPDDRLEVVVADDSDDDTAAVVRSFFADRAAPAFVLRERKERTGVAAAVNEAVAAASGDVVFRTDADATLADDVLRRAVAVLADPDVAAVTGRQAEVLGGSAVEAEYRSALARVQALESALDSTFIVHGPCVAFERAAFEPIDPDSLADDTEIAVRIRRAGHRVVMDPTLRFGESGVSGFAARRGRKDRRAMGLVRLLVRHRDALGRYGRYGRIVLPFNWWFLVVSPWALLLDVGVVTAALVAVAGPVGLAAPLALVGLGALGSRDALGPLQAVWALVDAQASLLLAQVRLVLRGGDGTWEPDRESREVFE
ncbi:MAG: glycosyltransferase [Halobacteriaceae archaeon]